MKFCLIDDLTGGEPFWVHQEDSWTPDEGEERVVFEHIFKITNQEAEVMERFDLHDTWRILMELSKFPGGGLGIGLLLAKLFAQGFEAGKKCAAAATVK